MYKQKKKVYDACLIVPLADLHFGQSYTTNGWIGREIGLLARRLV